MVLTVWVHIEQWYSLDTILSESDTITNHVLQIKTTSKHMSFHTCVCILCVLYAILTIFIMKRNLPIPTQDVHMPPSLPVSPPWSNPPYIDHCYWLITFSLTSQRDQQHFWVGGGVGEGGLDLNLNVVFGSTELASQTTELLTFPILFPSLTAIWPVHC